MKRVVTADINTPGTFLGGTAMAVLVASHHNLTAAQCIVAINLQTALYRLDEICYASRPV